MIFIFYFAVILRTSFYSFSLSAIMNKKLLICGAIATALLFTACVKKETPKDDEQEQVENQQAAASEPAQFEPLESVDPEPAAEIPEHVEVERHETENTTTEIRRETRPAQTEANAAEQTRPTVKAEAVKAEDKPTQAIQPKPNNSGAQTEDDAVAAAIAAATPALDN